MEQIQLPTWLPHRDSQKRRDSSMAIVEILLASRDVITESHLKELLSIAIWKYTEADGKYSTQFRSEGAIRNPKDKMNHEHVVTRKTIVQSLLSNPDKFREIMGSAIGCTVLAEEHRKITHAEKINPGLTGWDRYSAAGVAVFDLSTGERVI